MLISVRILNFLGKIRLENIDFKEEHDVRFNAKDNLILSSFQKNVSLPSTSYDKTPYPQN